MIYFDHNATTPLHPLARQTWLEAAERWIGNPSSPHRLGRRADAALEQTRRELAGLLECDPLDLVWTSGATESSNLVFHHYARTLPDDARIWVSRIEHPCVIGAARFFCGEKIQWIPCRPNGVVDLDWIQDHIRNHRPALVAVMAANNETGVLQPWKETARLCADLGVPLFCDAVQWLGKRASEGLGGCDWVSGSAHKFGGPKGAGFLKCPANAKVVPLLHGGPQEIGRRAGTECLPGILSMTAMLQFREKQIAAHEEALHLRRRSEFEEWLLGELPDCEIIGAGEERLWNTISVLMPVSDCRNRWLVKLDKHGVAASTGSACSSGKESSSHVLQAMGVDPSRTDQVLRFSAGWATTEKDWDGLKQSLRRAARDLLEFNGSVNSND